jgi:hypothetical protein
MDAFAAPVYIYPPCGHGAIEIELVNNMGHIYLNACNLSMIQNMFDPCKHRSTLILDKAFI